MRRLPRTGFWFIWQLILSVFFGPQLPIEYIQFYLFRYAWHCVVQYCAASVKHVVGITFLYVCCLFAEPNLWALCTYQVMAV